MNCTGYLFPPNIPPFSSTHFHLLFMPFSSQRDRTLSQLRLWNEVQKTFLLQAAPRKSQNFELKKSALIRIWIINFQNRRKHNVARQDRVVKEG